MIIGNSISPVNRVFLGGGGGTPVTPLLDTYSNGAASWSVFIQRAAYSGDFCIMRLDSDDSVQNLPYGVDGLPDLAALTLFADGGLVTMNTWFGQDLVGLDLTQPVTGSQPSLTDGSGNPLLENGILAPDFDGINDFMEVASSLSTFNFLHDGSDSTTFTVSKFGNISNPDALYTLLGNNNGSSNGRGVFFAYTDRSASSESDALFSIISNGSSNICINKNNDVITPNTQQIATLFMNAGDSTVVDRSKLYVNDGSVIKSNVATGAPSISNSLHNLQIGASGGGSNILTGSVQEITIFSADYLTEQSDIVTQINSRFNTFP